MASPARPGPPLRRAGLEARGLWTAQARRPRRPAERLALQPARFGCREATRGCIRRHPKLNPRWGSNPRVSYCLADGYRHGKPRRWSVRRRPNRWPTRCIAH